jgi:hypothetical protein
MAEKTGGSGARGRWVREAHGRVARAGRDEGEMGREDALPQAGTETERVWCLVVMVVLVGEWIVCVVCGI